MSTLNTRVHDDLVQQLLKFLSDYVANGNKVDTTTAIDEITIEGGSINAQTTFNKNAAIVEVTEDTVTYANNIPFPTKIVDRTSNDFLGSFYPADIDNDASPNYYGFERPDGKWLIMKEDTSAGTIRYAGGASAYATSWGNRATTVSYTLLSSVTWG